MPLYHSMYDITQLTILIYRHLRVNSNSRDVSCSSEPSHSGRGSAKSTPTREVCLHALLCPVFAARPIHVHCLRRVWNNIQWSFVFFVPITSTITLWNISIDFYIHSEAQILFNDLCMIPLWNMLYRARSVLNKELTQSVPNLSSFLKLLKPFRFLKGASIIPFNFNPYYHSSA